MVIEPLRDLILVAPEHDPGERAAASGLIVVQTHTPAAWRGVVLAVGPEVRDATVGARVIMSRLQGMELPDGILLPESAVLAFLEPADEVEPDEAERNVFEEAAARVEAMEER